jgi:hypothetical protein
LVGVSHKYPVRALGCEAPKTASGGRLTTPSLTFLRSARLSEKNRWVTSTKLIGSIIGIVIADDDRAELTVPVENFFEVAVFFIATQYGRGEGNAVHDVLLG